MNLYEIKNLKNYAVFVLCYLKSIERDFIKLLGDGMFKICFLSKLLNKPRPQIFVVVARTILYRLMVQFYLRIYHFG